MMEKTKWRNDNDLFSKTLVDMLTETEYKYNQESENNKPIYNFRIKLEGAKEIHRQFVAKTNQMLVSKMDVLLIDEAHLFQKQSLYHFNEFLSNVSYSAMSKLLLRFNNKSNISRILPGLNYMLPRVTGEVHLDQFTFGDACLKSVIEQSRNSSILSIYN